MLRVLTCIFMGLAWYVEGQTLCAEGRPSCPDGSQLDRSTTPPSCSGGEKLTCPDGSEVGLGSPAPTPAPTSTPAPALAPAPTNEDTSFGWSITVCRTWALGVSVAVTFAI
eukprot:gnl/MRDRNA2_/MRDRNA2_82523_c0_seq1.p1 gnl/MRDRNA2_/MRDRNA2_82523_c0~~gnl/MRDRNA2_/MRDRNA2_82523_c0_seq1.p1  ORF type:complete len:111 (-),score=14.86 gnl/MRDRNA2_/MRDRNA2_82523_c0_seq1:258-590(-)